MSLTEFQVIDRFFRDCGVSRKDVVLGVGDDAAVLECPAGMRIVAAIDTLVEGVHFLPGCPAASVGHRALAVNLSDMAAMGARPAWALLAMTLPSVDETWLSEFASGFSALAREHGVTLVGGDTTSGHLTVTVQILGLVPSAASYMPRAGGRAGDVLFVTGTPGDAAAGLALEQGKLTASSPEAESHLRRRFLYPTPRVALGERLREYAIACIDVSDGLLGDAGKLAAASGCGVEIAWESLQVSSHLASVVGDERARELALTGGDDYELCFCVPPGRVDALLNALPPEEWGYHRIGTLRADVGAIVTRQGSVIEFSHSGFDHFARERAGD